MDKGKTQTNGPKDKEIDDDGQGLSLKGWHRHTMSIKGETELANIVDCVDATIQELKDYTKKDWLMQPTTSIWTELTWKQIKKSRRKKIWRKTTIWILVRNKRIAHRRGNLKRETESQLTVAQNNVIRTNYIKVKIDKILKSSKYSLHDDRDKTVNHIISEFSKLAQKEHNTKMNIMTG